MAKYSMKKGGKEVGSASVYAEPHTSTGKKLTNAFGEFGTNPGFGPNLSKLDTADVSLGQYSKSAGNEPDETEGVKIRGTGAATKGLIARGPMA